MVDHHHDEDHDADHDDGYVGPATLHDPQSGTAIDVQVTLRGHFQPIDGLYHWYGRIAADQRIDQLTGGRKTQVRIQTPDGEATGALSDQDPWGRWRIDGTGKPPFAIATVDTADTRP